MATVALVEDHALVRSGLRLLLESFAHTVTFEAGTAEDALANLAPGQAEVIILDLNLPGMSGLEAVHRLSERGRVLVLSMHEEPEYVSEVLARGGQGYVPKRAVDQDLLEAVTRLANGERYLDPGLAIAIAERVSLGPATDGAESLSERERETILALAGGYSVRQIAERAGLSEKTVGTYKQRAQDKLGLSDLPSLIAWARRHGLV